MFFYLLSIVIFFTLIHFIECIAVVARCSGVVSGHKSLAFSIQRAITMLTRFFSMLMLPFLGYLIDAEVERVQFLLMVSFALLFASISGLIVIFTFKFWVFIFIKVIESYKINGGLLYQFIKIPFYFYRSSTIRKNRSSDLFDEGPDSISFDIFKYSIFIYFIYSISIFFFFYLALIFNEYKTMLSHMSGITNMFAAVLLTFIVEPKISLRIDESSSKVMVDSRMILFGRLVGVGLVSQVLVWVLIANEVY